MTGPVVVEDAPPAGWNASTVDVPGGHVYQSVEWATHRARSGWRPRYVSVGDRRVLALSRQWPFVGGSSAYLPRGPVWRSERPVGDEVGETLWEATRALAVEGVDVVAADPEVPATDAAYRDWLRRARFHAIEEIQPSRHRVAIDLDGRSEHDVFAGIAKSTRQRIRKAEPSTSVVRFDRRAEPAGVGEGFATPAEEAAAALDRFYDLLLETGERRQFTFGSRAEFVSWWRDALAAGHLVYLEARSAARSGDVLAGLVLYRHGRRLSTVHSGDHAGLRHDHPGALHLLRWRAIQLALREGRAEMDLGGVDVAGARRPPVEGEPIYGLYQHKLSFGAEWVELAGAHERVIRRNRYRAGRGLAALARRLPTIGR